MTYYEYEYLNVTIDESNVQHEVPFILNERGQEGWQVCGYQEKEIKDGPLGMHTLVEVVIIFKKEVRLDP